MSMNMFDMLNLVTGSQDTAAISKAIDKVKAEMEKEISNAYVQEIGKFLLEQININPDMAGQILNPNKTIVKSLDAMQKVAAQKKIGNFAVIAPQEAISIIIGYYKDNKAQAGVSNNKADNDERAVDNE